MGTAAKTDNQASADRAAQIRGLLAQRDRVDEQIARLLREEKDERGKAGWLRWCRQEFGWRKSSAYERLDPKQVANRRARNADATRQKSNIVGQPPWTGGPQQHRQFVGSILDLIEAWSGAAPPGEMFSPLPGIVAPVPVEAYPALALRAILAVLIEGRVVPAQREEFLSSVTQHLQEVAPGLPRDVPPEQVRPLPESTGHAAPAIIGPMRIYFAGDTRVEAREHTILNRGVTRRLLSYESKDAIPNFYLPLFRQRAAEGQRVEVMLDCGAYSAWTKGTPLSLEEYAQFIKANAGAFDVVANLDVIAGAPTRKATADEIEKAAEEGWDNWVQLTAELKPLGIEPMHTYHYGESLDWLKRLRDAAEFFALGGTARLSSATRRAWFDAIMPYLTDDEGYPIRKFHGFGMTSFDLMARYPWASVDSTAWMWAANCGACLIPLNGVARKVDFSADSPTHFTRHTPAEQQEIRAYLEGQGLADPRMLGEDYIRRDEVNVAAFLDFEQQREPRPWTPLNAPPRRPLAAIGI